MSLTVELIWVVKVILNFDNSFYASAYL